MKLLRKLFFTSLFLAYAVFYNPQTALALPSFSRQTGQECMACHVGSFGPQLTSYGRDFKLNGYTANDGHDKAMWKGISAMVMGGYEHTRKNLPPGSTADDIKSNNNVIADQTSIFYGGQLTEHTGIFTQATYDGAAEHFSWDNTDVRYANNTTLAGKYFVYGVTLNNNPSVQDIWQTAPAWQFPYASSKIAPRPDAAPFMTGLGQTVGGVGVYGMWNQLLYVELSGYHTLADHVQRTFGDLGVSGSDHLSGIAPYWRIALQHDMGKHYFSVGTFGMDSDRYPGNDRSAGTDNMLDTAVDATYQYVSDSGDHNISLYSAYLHEHQKLSATYALKGSSRTSNSLNSFNANASYYYKNTYGITLGRFDIAGTADALLYPNPSNNRPDSAGWTVQLDATPFGHANSLGWPYLNTRFFMQYTMYDKFNGLKNNYDGTGRNASDNNTLYTGIWFAF